MSPAVLVALMDARARLRDRSLLILAVGAPVLLAGLLVGATGSSPSGAPSAQPSEQVLIVHLGETSSRFLAYFGPSMAVGFLFFGGATAARGFWIDCRRGLVQRLVSGGAARSSILLGKSASMIGASFAAVSIVWGVNALVLGASWGDPATVSVLLAATALASSGTAMTLASLAKNEDEVDAYVTIGALALALIGGAFVQAGRLPGGMSGLRLLTPTGWAIDGLNEARLGAGLRALAVHLLVLAALGLALAAFGVYRIAGRDVG